MILMKVRRGSDILILFIIYCSDVPCLVLLSPGVNHPARWSIDLSLIILVPHQLAQSLAVGHQEQS